MQAYTSNFYYNCYVYLSDVIFDDNFAYFVGLQYLYSDGVYRRISFKYNMSSNECVPIIKDNPTGSNTTYKFAATTPSKQMKILGTLSVNSSDRGTYCYTDLNNVNAKYKISDDFDWNFLGGIEFSDENNGTAYIHSNLYKTTNGGINWQQILSVPSAVIQGDDNLQVFGDLIYAGCNQNSRLYYKNIGLTMSTVFDNAAGNWGININGSTYNTPSNNFFRYGTINVSTPTEDPTDKVFYCWNDGSMSRNRNDYSLTYASNISNIYKTRQKTTEDFAISNANQTKAIRIASNGSTPMVHSSIGGIFYSESSSPNVGFGNESVVNGGQDYAQLPNSNTADNNKNPSINEIKYFSAGDNSNAGAVTPAVLTMASVWERRDPNTNNTDILCALGTTTGGYNLWTRYGSNLSALDGKITTFSTAANFNSKPDIYSIFCGTDNTDVRDYLMIVPHLEPASNGRLVVSVRYKNFQGYDNEALRVEDIENYETNDYKVIKENVSDYSVTYSPVLINNSKGVYLYFTYKKNGNIITKET
ncbi:MAG: hypothetical protein PHN88_06305 [Ignavibacteria bacterium]|nr:hypothetical protein [Ignavibacteria bacterium]